MKRWIARRLFAAALATCGICASAWAGAHPRAQSQYDGLRSYENRHGGEPVGTWGATPANEMATPYFADIPMTVVGTYGRTTLDMLSSGPFMLVKWPDGCCPESKRWRTDDTRQSHGGDNQHVIFLWPAL
ncbi:hypothetical protein R75461_05993 [Paraburkholderia nemoris]|jgi:hypothetical protein|uniref:hypothetical protein n=1 Tax=Paraburkholderia TaxID=1822464 RepID=UPI00190B0A76|nr:MULTISPECIES: hypothetical protein [Paraburkholderia]MBK5122083.1 hypothetical protein [Burkholderia sp. R-69980]MBK5185463.1 hypothetical protein [Burkholderia sp. R-69749]MBK3785735.1 hypothetical protein [Paraburkholderia aspalathi]CAE6818577.1 hypothetical protein R75461_05993 [Paraburkholderia nemoris]CAE6889755.1 hypothetical protein R69749_07540 [Paraburkholderia domus]